MSVYVLRNIRIDLFDPDSIDAAIAEINQVRKDIRKMCESLVRKLTEQGIEIAKMQIASLNAVATGELEQSIQGVYFPGERLGVVYSDCPYALFVEYGTGPVGEKSKHPEYGKAQWAYNIGPRIGPNKRHPEWGDGWLYFNEKDGHWHWTSGQPARPYMYNTLKRLVEAAEREGSHMFRGY